MPVHAYFTDIILRWRLADVGAILVIALWSAFATRSAQNARSVVVVVAVTLVLSFSAQVYSRAGANVLVHALAAAASALIARAVAIRLSAWSRATRIVLALAASAIGYATGRAMAILLL